MIGLAIELHRALGPGLLESAYEECLFYKIVQAGLKAEKQKAIINQVKSELNPLFKVKEALPLEILPRTASGKLMRRNLRSMYEKENKHTQQ